MADPSASLWISQAESDRHSATRLYDPVDHRTYCQSIAKHQQVVGKSIKAIAVAAHDADFVKVDREHYYRHDVDRLISMLRRLPKIRDARDVSSLIKKLLTEHYQAEIKTLSDLRPRGKPATNGVHPRNTEYPFETSKGVWTYPAHRDAFAVRDVDRFQRLAERIFQGAMQIVSALRRR